MNEVYIITEGTKKTGFGHLTRCLSLYQSFIEKKIFPFLVVHGDETSASLLEGTNHIVLNWITQYEQLLDLLPSKSIVIIDTLLADISLIEKIIIHVSHPVIIDDYKRQSYSKGIIIDWTIFSESLYQTKNLYLAGTNYVALRKDFWNVPPKKINSVVKNILITMGGNDIRNLTPGILYLIQEKFPDFNIRVIVGKAFTNEKEIVAKKEKNKETELLYNLNASQMVTAFTEADIVISAGGQTLYELARIGTPTIAVQIIDNQKFDIEGWLKTGFIDFAGNWDDIDLRKKISGFLNILIDDFTLRKKKSELGRKFVDGKGAERIVTSLLDYGRK